MPEAGSPLAGDGQTGRRDLGGMLGAGGATRVVAGREMKSAAGAWALVQPAAAVCLCPWVLAPLQAAVCFWELGSCCWCAWVRLVLFAGGDVFFCCAADTTRATHNGFKAQRLLGDRLVCCDNAGSEFFL